MIEPDILDFCEEMVVVIFNRTDYKIPMRCIVNEILDHASWFCATAEESYMFVMFIITDMLNDVSPYLHKRFMNALRKIDTLFHENLLDNIGTFYERKNAEAEED